MGWGDGEENWEWGSLFLESFPGSRPSSLASEDLWVRVQRLLPKVFAQRVGASEAAAAAQPAQKPRLDP